ncbi:MAG TPA: sulfotransferase, partial [Gaiellaceae bacterium]|nr:sulfotransferase [Gaiellaceae bacterium]
WKRLLDAFEAARAEVGPERWLDVRYEDLVARPREETAAALRFVGLDAPEGLDREISRLKVTAGRADAYLDELRPEDVILLDSLLGPTLARWGYATREAA